MKRSINTTGRRQVAFATIFSAALSACTPTPQGGGGGSGGTGGGNRDGGGTDLPGTGGAVTGSGGTPASGGMNGGGGAMQSGGAGGGGPAGTGGSATGGSGGVGAGGGATGSGGGNGSGGGGLGGRGGGSGGAGGRTGSGGGAGGGGGTAGRGGAGGSGPGGAAGTGVMLVNTIDLKGVSGCPGMRLGDIDGDGRLEMVVGQPVDQSTLGSFTPQRVAAVTVFDLKGNQVWQYGTPNKFHVASSDIPLQVYDLDGDGKAEIFANMSTTEMTVLDGTGKVMRKIKLPQAGANDSIAFANLRGTAWPQDIIVKTRYGAFWAITGIDSAAGPAGTVLWTHRKGPDTDFDDGSTGHYPLAYDFDGDGKDEVMGGYDFMDATGKTLWSVTTLGLHADTIAAGDLDGNAANGKEIVVCGDYAAAFEWKTGKRLWQDMSSIEVQQAGLGNYRPELPGLEVALLDRLRTEALGLKSNNILVDGRGNVVWKENRPNNSGWLTVTENLNNWDGQNTDLIFSYRRGTGGGFLYDGTMRTVAAFPYPGTSEQNFALHADLCGDEREEVIIYDESKAWIYANGGCDLNAAPAKPRLPQQYHLYNWSIYTGWINPDVRFYTPATKP